MRKKSTRYRYLKKKLVVNFLILFYCFGNAIAQKSTSFDKIHSYLSTEVAQKNLDKAISGADSLYRASADIIHRMRSLMLLARLYQQKEDLDKSVSYTLELANLAEESNDYMWQARAYGYLAGLYRMMELYSKAETFSKRALVIIPNIKDAEQAKSTQGLMLQELAFSNQDQGNYKQAIYYLSESGKVFAKLGKNKDEFLINNERLLGDNHRLLESYNAALNHYHKARAMTVGKPDTYITGLIYKGIAEAELKSGNLDTAKVYLDKAMKIADESKYLQIKETIYALSKEYYKKVNDREQLADAREKKDSVTDALLDKRAQLLDNKYLELEQTGITVESLGAQRNIIIITGVIVLMTGGVFFYAYKLKQDRELSIFRNWVKENNLPTMASDNVIVNRSIEVSGPFVTEQAADHPRGIISISAETEQLLKTGLNEFENSSLFLKNGISLPVLAAQLNTNTKYLSHIIKLQKQADFNGYVNRLRINYVVTKLQKDPTWRQYKVSALADASGFSSPSQFAAIFKSTTGLSPSAFLRQLSNNS